MHIHLRWGSRMVGGMRSANGLFHLETKAWCFNLMPLVPQQSVLAIRTVAPPVCAPRKSLLIFDLETLAKKKPRPLAPGVPDAFPGISSGIQWRVDATGEVFCGIPIGLHWGSYLLGWARVLGILALVLASFACIGALCCFMANPRHSGTEVVVEGSIAAGTVILAIFQWMLYHHPRIMQADKTQAAALLERAKHHAWRGHDHDLMAAIAKIEGHLGAAYANG